MELKEFIKAAVIDITDAIRELQNELKNGTIVNPCILPPGETQNCVLDGDDIRKIENLKFDVAVTVSDSTTTGAKAKAGINVFGASVDAASNKEKENVSRLTFSIPVVFPSVHVKSSYDDISSLISKDINKD